MASSAGITQITLTQDGWMYYGGRTLTLRADGTALFQGGSLDPRPGSYTGSFPPSQFPKLAEAIASKGFFSLWFNHYTRRGFDRVEQRTSLTRIGQTRTIIDEGEDCPENLQEINDTIEGFGERICWRKVILRPREKRNEKTIKLVRK